ncbi:acyl-CoA carboxylase subunit epsilon [Spongiactinospora rosea]|uniref:Acyl-CoA carboxylase subunit epsilon n=1 Tax=Spongiactinospora rosea TaxID=2248750 RepID=A0A366LYX9_9ACTN|nr:acyl-CoA carboxylase epsilon subunit [Spongiactinospora rosea]RBQ19178.1 acyl-CoA carboxylase subunit epsilon [Spongiactinospora rosea]
MREHADAPLLRVERGALDPVELAVVTAVLLRRRNAARRRPAPWRSAAPAPWRRPQPIPAYRGPRSWQAQAA